jgi:hypothetical protein
VRVYVAQYVRASWFVRISTRLLVLLLTLPYNICLSLFGVWSLLLSFNYHLLLP